MLHCGGIVYFHNGIERFDGKTKGGIQQVYDQASE